MQRTLILLASSLLVAVAGIAAESGGPDPAQIAPAPGSGGAGGKAAPSGGFDPTMILIMGLLVVFLWLMVIRPQKKEEKKRQELVASIKPGHKVVTIGGVHGEVTAVGEATVDVRIGEEGKGMVVTFNKGAIATNVTATTAAAK
jgi:preprotein translocase subunit YajC